MNTRGIVGAVIGTVVGLLALGWLVQGNDFFMYKIFAPKYEQVRRETFEQTKSYRQGMIQELQNMQMEYIKVPTQSQRDSMASIILHRAADFPEADMPPDLRIFIAGLRQERTSNKKY